MMISASFGLQLAVILTLFILVRASFEERMLNLHNEFRKRHGTPELKLDKEACNECKKLAEEVAQKTEAQVFEFDAKYGQNLCWAAANPLHCVSLWYDEINDYDFNRPGYRTNAAQFTQLIWKSTKLLGVGMGKSKSGAIFVVARYMPRGNVFGEFKKNVPKQSIAARLNCHFRSFILTGLALWLFPSIHIQVFCQS